MPAPFTPPPLESLALVDVAEGVHYPDCPIVIEGVVSPRGQSGWYGRGSACNVHLFSFAGWRRPGEGLIRRELTLLRPVPPFTDGHKTFIEAFFDG